MCCLLSEVVWLTNALLPPHFFFQLDNKVIFIHISCAVFQSIKTRCALQVFFKWSSKQTFSISDNTASILTRRASYSRLHQSVYLVPVVITDGDYPMQSSTGTLTVRVCTCDREGNKELCNAEALSSSPGLSTGALIAILLCAIILLSTYGGRCGLKYETQQWAKTINTEIIHTAHAEQVQCKF